MVQATSRPIGSHMFKEKNMMENLLFVMACAASILLCLLIVFMCVFLGGVLAKVLAVPFLMGWYVL